MDNRIDILVVDDNKMFREMLTKLLSDYDYLEVVGSAVNGREAYELSLKLHPDVILMDLEMPEIGGLSAIRNITEINKKVKIIVLTNSDSSLDLFESLRLGAKGYIVKSASSNQIIEAINAVNDGGALVSPIMAQFLINEFCNMSSGKQEKKELPKEITRRELEILQLLSDGMSNKQIASKLFLSEKTVKNHVSNILNKLQVNSRTEAISRGFKEGWLDIEK